MASKMQWQVSSQPSSAMPGKTGNTSVQTLAAEQGTLPSMYFCRRDKDRGGRLVLDINSRFNTTLLKLLSVRRTKKP